MSEEARSRKLTEFWCNPSAMRSDYAPGNHLFASASTVRDFCATMDAGKTWRIGGARHFWLALFFTVAAQGADEAHTEALKTGNGFLNYGEPKFLVGSIYAPNPNRLLFTFKRVVERAGATLNVQREFNYPDGRSAVREHVIYDGDRLVSYELDELQTGARGLAKIRHAVSDGSMDTVEFEYSGRPGIRPRMHTEPLQPNTMVADMMGAWLASQYHPLKRGEKLNCRLIVVPLTGTVGFTLVKESEASQGDQQVLIVKMEPTSPFISVLLAPLFFTMENSPPHRILQCSGRTLPKIQVGDNWRDLDAVTVFDWQSSR